MAALPPESLDEYEIFLTETMTSWSPQQRVALAAGIAERWLPAYEAFSAAEQWGDAVSLRRSLQAVWDHMLGRPLTAAGCAYHREQVEASTPHMDDFDADEALTACLALAAALQCCTSSDNLPATMQAVLGIFESLDWPEAAAAQRRAWRKSAIRKEVAAQLKLIEEIAASARIDEQAVKALRASVASAKKTVAARKEPRAPATVSNKTAYEQYRRVIESDLKQKPAALAGDEFLFGLALFAEWMARYTRRIQIVKGDYGRLGDEVGLRALMAWQQARDRAATGLPRWSDQVQQTIDMCYQNNCLMKTIDVGSPTQPHAYGPSLRRLCLEAEKKGQAGPEALLAVRDWARHRPASWTTEDLRRKQGLAHDNSELGQRLACEVSWQANQDPLCPWSADIAGEHWLIHLNDFPDDLLYRLVINDVSVADFHDWPPAWRR